MVEGDDAKRGRNYRLGWSPLVQPQLIHESFKIALLIGYCKICNDLYHLVIGDYLMVGLTSPSDTKVMNAPAPPLIAPDSVRERLVDIMNNVFTLVVCLGLRKSMEKLAQ